MNLRNSDLSEYYKKRDFSVTNEPKGQISAPKSKALQFVVQKHGARRLHYDFRLELDGVMKSWAVTRGPSFNPKDKRLAVQTEDHPIEYNKFEGVIPDKQYGAGPVMIWDKGTWEPEGDVRQAFRKGHLVFSLKGARMKGRWHLVLMKGKSDKRENWLLIKGDDGYSLSQKENENFLIKENTSIISGRTLEDIRSGTIKPQKLLPHLKVRQKKLDASFASLQKKYGQVELATLVEFPPSDSDWLHEIKYDGYRILAFICGGDVLMQTRGRQDWTHKFPVLVSELRALPIDCAVLDGEVAVLDQRGTTNFSALQKALRDEKGDRIEAWFFDLLYLDGEDYTKRPLIERKKALEELLKIFSKGSHIHYSDHFESDPDLLEKACKLGAEGIVSKNKGSLYRGRRTRDWVKSKCGLEQEFVIGGFMPAKDKSKAVGSLLLGYYREGNLHFAGKLGTGFDNREARILYQKLTPLKADRSPFKEKLEKGARDYVWVQPSQICEVSFWEWTPDKRIRHASYKGLREDKKPEEIHEEIPEISPVARRRPSSKPLKKVFTVEGVNITHHDREVYPGLGITKGDLAFYYAKALPFLLPFAERRLISLLRCTDSIEEDCFFQRAPLMGGKGNVYGLTVQHKGKKHNYMYVENGAGIIELAQFRAIEFHGWQSRIGDIDKPDQIIFDLDPSDDVSFEAVKLAAKDVRSRLKNLGINSFPRITGGKGIHIAVPLRPRLEWGAIKKFAQNFSSQMVADAPDAYTANMSKIKRTGKIFIDYFRNDFSSTAIVPFSLRARAGAPVAIPVSWRELSGLDTSAAFSFFNVEKRLNKRTQGLIEEYFQSAQSLNL